MSRRKKDLIIYGQNIEILDIVWYIHTPAIAQLHHHTVSAQLTYVGRACLALALPLLGRPTQWTKIQAIQATLYFLSNSVGLKGLNIFWKASKVLWNLQVDLKFNRYRNHQISDLLKVTKSRKQFLELLILPKNEWKTWKNYPKSSQDNLFSCFVRFLE